MLDLRILFASQTGNAEGVAKALGRAADGFAVDYRVSAMDKVRLADLHSAKTVLFVVSTTGIGDMPDNGQALWREALAAAPDSLQGTEYAVLALGDSLYDDFCQAGKNWDKRLRELGASPLRARVDCDNDYEATALAWIAETLAMLKDKYGWQTAVFRETAPPPAKGFDKTAPIEALVREVRVLTQSASPRTIVHIDLAVDDDIVWKTGDLFYVLPRNGEAAVAEMLSALPAKAGDSVICHDKRMRLDEALYAHLDIQHAGRALLSALDINTPYAPLAQMLREHPVLDAQDTVELLRPLRPRAYSTASAPGNLALTVGVVRYEKDGRIHHGTASNYLAALRKGSVIQGYFADNRNFTLPEDDYAPIIMIATGTGIAPFRAFLQTRAQRQAGGLNWLLVGNRNRAYDYLYGEELNAFYQNGTLARLHTAFSREQESPCYVQDLLRRHSADIYAWLVSRAYLYVCGGKAMARAVEEMLIELIAEHGRMPRDNAVDYLLEVKKEKRYVRDVY